MIQILIIDENPYVHEHIKSLLVKTQAFSSVGVHEGLEAIDLFKLGYKFDVILLDWEMHTLSGLRTFEGIRKLGITTPVIKMTRSIPTGVESCLVKPFNLDVLIEKIEAVLGVKTL